MKRIVIAVACALTLAACGPADVETAANEAASALPSVPAELAASAEALAEEAEALASGIEALASSGDLEAAASAIEGAAAELEALANQFNEPLRLQTDQPLVLDTAQEIAGVTNYKWTIAEAPAGAEGVEGEVISENSNGKLTIEPADYARYFPAPGEYQVDLVLTFEDGSVQSVLIPVVVP
jgi:hypothetical protein